MKFDIAKTTVQAILDAKQKADDRVKELSKKWNEARLAFLQDCDRIDNALTGEKNSLQNEVTELSATIKRLSAQLASGIAGGERLDGTTKDTLRRLIHEATAKREEAEATLTGLSDVVPEYNKELYDAAVQAKDNYMSTLKGEYAETVTELYNVLEKLKQAVEAADSTVRNRESSYGVDDEYQKIQNRYSHSNPNQKILKPAVVENPVRMLGEPMRRPAYLDEQPKEPTMSKRTTKIFFHEGHKVTQIVDNETGKILRETVD